MHEEAAEATHSSSESQSEPLLYCGQTDSCSGSQGTAYFGALGSKRTCQLEKLQQKVGQMQQQNNKGATGGEAHLNAAKSYDEMDSNSFTIIDSVKPQVANLASSIELDQACLNVENDAANRVYRAVSFADTEANENKLRDSFEIHCAKLKNSAEQNRNDLLT